MSDPAPTSPAAPTLDLKNRAVAAVLALLVPGLGHLYQGRLFKAAVYAVCILGLFVGGQALGDWKVVYLGDSDSAGRLNAGRGLVRRLLQGYGAQFPVGIAAWPAMIQSMRYHSPQNTDHLMAQQPVTAPFAGGLWSDTANGPRLLLELTGTVSLEPAGGGMHGTFEGQTADGKPISLKIDRVRDLGRPISANEDRTLDARLTAIPEGVVVPEDGITPALRGGLQRPFLNRYQVPLGEQGEDRLTADLGAERVEIAYMFTWIAGLLNILAIWDALDGPAYGFGNEPELTETSRRRRKRKGEKTGEEPADNIKPNPVPATPRA